jgi:aryl-alcohol dehydrogenase-like predicted oxidoreductase
VQRALACGVWGSSGLQDCKRHKPAAGYEVAAQVVPTMLQHGPPLTANFTLAGGLVTGKYATTPNSAQDGWLDEFSPHMARVLGERAGTAKPRAPSAQTAAGSCWSLASDSQRMCGR